MHWVNHRVLTTVFLFSSLAPALAQLKINEVYYNVNGPQEANQFIELYNAGGSTVYLDGLILTDEAGTGVEGIFRFPGSGTDHPVAPGEYVLIAADADGSDGFAPDLSLADWECYTGAGDYDNSSVSNLTLVGGSQELSLSVGGDSVILADGTDTSAPIDAATILDGMNYNNGGGELAGLSAAASEGDASVVAGLGYSLARCPDGADGDVSSTADFVVQNITPGTGNGCSSPLPFLSISDTSVPEPVSGTTQAVFVLTLSIPSTGVVSVLYATANGTATAGSDYTAVPATLLTFGIGVQTQTVSVVVLSDFADETNETFFVNLSSVTNASLADAQGKCTIAEITPPAFVRMARQGSVITNVWSAVSGITYRVQYSPTLLSASWTTVGSDVVASGSQATNVDPSAGAATQRYYRVLRLN